MSSESALRSRPQRALTGEEFRDVIGHFASGVTVVTVVKADGTPTGTTASAVCSLSLEPPMILVCMNRASSTGQAMATAGAFAVNVLTEDQPSLAQRFAGKAPDKFEGVPMTLGSFGQPLLEASLAQIECRVAETVTGGTHVVFLAEVMSATARSGAPLAYFRGQFGRLQVAQDEAVHHELRERVLSGALPPGESFELLALAEDLNAPPGSVFHALGRLITDGLVSRTDGGTFMVPPVSWSAVKEALDGCCAIEFGVVGRVAAPLAKPALDGVRAAMARSLTRITPGSLNDADEAVRAYAAFHEAIVGLAGAPALVTAFQRLSLAGIMARTFRAHVATEADAAFGGDHRDLVAALEVGDPARAAEVVVRHYDRFEHAFAGALALRAHSSSSRPNDW